jgi:hypothetical protein
MKHWFTLVLTGLLSLCLIATSLASQSAYAQQTVTTEPPPQPMAPAGEPCPKGQRGGAIGGIVVGSVFLWVLPMSIPVLITQTKKLKAHNRARDDRRCQYAPRR